MTADDHASRGAESNSNYQPSNGSAARQGSGIVVNCRVRLSRNIADFPFLGACSDRQLEQIETRIRQTMASDDRMDPLAVVDAESDSEPDVLASFQSLPPGSREADGFDPIDEAAAMINCEDHLRIQVYRAGLDLESAWETANHFDELFEQHLCFAFSPRWGYLTACPANVGTGLRASVLVHVPGLVITDRLEPTIRHLRKLNLIGREAFGDPDGEFFRIANQATLGFGEQELIDRVELGVAELVESEWSARQQLVTGQKEKLQYEVNVALERLVATDLEDVSEPERRELIQLLSRVRLGIQLELIERSDVYRMASKFELFRLRHQLDHAISLENYQLASRLRDRILVLEGGLA